MFPPLPSVDQLLSPERFKFSGAAGKDAIADEREERRERVDDLVLEDMKERLADMLVKFLTGSAEQIRKKKAEEKRKRNPLWWTDGIVNVFTAWKQQNDLAFAEITRDQAFLERNFSQYVGGLTEKALAVSEIREGLTDNVVVFLLDVSDTPGILNQVRALRRQLEDFAKISTPEESNAQKQKELTALRSLHLNEEEMQRQELEIYTKYAEAERLYSRSEPKMTVHIEKALKRTLRQYPNLHRAMFNVIDQYANKAFGPSEYLKSYYVEVLNTALKELGFQAVLVPPTPRTSQEKPYTDAEEYWLSSLLITYRPEELQRIKNALRPVRQLSILNQ